METTCCSNDSMNLMHVFYELSDNVLLHKDVFFYTYTTFIAERNVCMERHCFGTFILEVPRTLVFLFCCFTE